MKIESLHIDGFGHFHDCEIGPFENPLTVISGPNEAGKSTLLAFIRTMLFGFPKRGRKEFYPPLAGGQHGGRIQLVSQSGARYLIERTAGTNGGKVRIAASYGDVFEGDDQLKKLLGHASPTMFETVFAFGLDELTNLNSLNDDDVSGRIYSAGMGANQLPEALKTLEDQRHKLFKNGGSSQKISKILNELKKVEDELEQINKEAAKYQRFVARRDAIGPEVESLSNEVERHSSDLREIKRLESGWEDWVRLTELEKQLSQLPVHESFPEDGLSRLNALEERHQQEKDELLKAENELKTASEEASTPIADERLLEDAEDIGPLHKNLGAFESSVANLPKRQTELRNQEEILEEALRELGTDWDEKRLQDFDSSLPVQAAIQEWNQRLNENEQALRESRHHAEAANRDEKDAAEAATEARDELQQAEEPTLDAAELDRRRAILRNARSRFDDYRMLKQRREDLEIQSQQTSSALEKEQELAQRGSKTWVPVGGLGLVSVVMGVVLGGQTATFGVIIGVILLFGAAYLFANRKGRSSPAITEAMSSLREHLVEAKRGEARAQKALDKVAELLDERHLDSQKLNELETSLDETAAKIDRWEKASTKLEAATKEEERRRNRAQDAKEAEQKAEKALQDAKTEWEAWLKERGFDDSTLSPTTVTEIFNHVEKTQLLLKTLEHTRSHVKAIQEDIDDYRSRVVPLAEKHGMIVPDSQMRDVASAAEAMSSRLDAVREELSRKNQAEKAVVKAVRERNTREKHVADAKDKLYSLLQMAGTDNPEDFRVMASEYTEGERLEQEISLCKMRLQQLGGTGEDFTRFREKLSKTSPTELEDSERATQVALNVATEKKELLLMEQGRVQNDIERLAGEDEASELRLKRAALIEQLKADAKEWSVLTLASKLLDKARSKYEQERQPGVLKNAQGFFTTVTGNAYKKNRFTARLKKHQRGRIQRHNKDARKPEPRHKGTALPRPPLRPHPTVRRARNKPPRHRGRGIGELRSRPSPKSRRSLRQARPHESGPRLHLPSVHGRALHHSRPRSKGNRH